MTHRSPLHDAEGLAKFFGVSLQHVNFMLLRIPMTLEYWPDWLKATPKLVDLPRYNMTGEHLIGVRGRSITDTCKGIVWIVENLNEGWHLDTDGFKFEDELEAIHFRLWF